MRVLKLVTSATLWLNKILCQNCGNDITRRQLKSLEDFRLHQLPHHHHTTVEPGFKSLTSPATLHFLSSHLRHPCHPCHLYHLPLMSCGCQPTRWPPPVIQHQRCHRRHPSPRHAARRRRSPAWDGWKPRCRRLERRWAHGPGQPGVQASLRSAGRLIMSHPQKKTRRYYIDIHTTIHKVQKYKGGKQKIPRSLSIGPDISSAFKKKISLPTPSISRLAWPSLDLQRQNFRCELGWNLLSCLKIGRTLHQGHRYMFILMSSASHQQKKKTSTSPNKSFRWSPPRQPKESSVHFPKEFQEWFKKYHPRKNKPWKNPSCWNHPGWKPTISSFNSRRRNGKCLASPKRSSSPKWDFSDPSSEENPSCENIFFRGEKTYRFGWRIDSWALTFSMAFF